MGKKGQIKNAPEIVFEDFKLEAVDGSFVPDWFRKGFSSLINSVIKEQIVKKDSDKNKKAEKEEVKGEEKAQGADEYVKWEEKEPKFKVTGYLKYEERINVSMEVYIGIGDSIKHSKIFSNDIDKFLGDIPTVIEQIVNFVKFNSEDSHEIKINIDYDKSIQKAVEILENNKDDSSIEKTFLTGLFLAKANQEEKALEKLNFVINNSTNPEMIQECYKEILIVKASKGVKDLDSAKNEVYAGDPAKAIELIQSLLQITPKYLHLHFLLGTAYKRSGEIEKSIEEFRKVIEFDPNHAASYRELAEELVSIDKLEKAEEAFKKLTEMGQANATDYYNYGMCLKRMDKLEGMDEIIEKIKELDTERKLDSYIFNLFDINSMLLQDNEPEPEKKQSFWGKIFGKK